MSVTYKNRAMKPMSHGDGNDSTKTTPERLRSVGSELRSPAMGGLATTSVSAYTPPCKYSAVDRSNQAAQNVSFSLLFRDTQKPRLNTEFGPRDTADWLVRSTLASDAAGANERQLRRVEDEQLDHAGLLKMRAAELHLQRDRRRAVAGRAVRRRVLGGVHADAAVLNNIWAQDGVVVLVHVRMSEQHERQRHCATGAATRARVARRRVCA